MSCSPEDIGTLLQETRDEITRVDSKTSVLLAGLTAVVTVLLATASGGSRLSRLSNDIEWLAWLGGLALCLATAGLAVAIWPHLTPGRRSRPHYFADFAMFDTGAELVEALGECDMGERNVEQLRVLSRAVLRKYKWLRNALRCAAAGSTALILVGLIVQARGHP